ncbi:ABC transporter substrate-binding protein [Myroides sp. LJL119]
MKSFYYLFISLVVFLSASSCQEKSNLSVQEELRQARAKNEILFAKGFSLENYDSYSIVRVKTPWQDAKENFVYILHKKDATLPDSLKNYTKIQVPVTTVVATSTTHLPAIELLQQTTTLKGFPGLDYISSLNFRSLIEKNEIVELGQNESINTEQLLDIDPNVVIAFAMDGGNRVLQNIAQSGIPVLYNGDWVEQSALGKAEWIKLFGALYDKQQKATTLFNQIVTDYNQVLQKLKHVKDLPTVLSGSMYQDVWYLPQGQSWAAQYFKDAKSNYLWANTLGTGSDALSFEAVFDKGKDAEFWINPGHYTSLKQMQHDNAHYANFSAFKNQKVYSFSLTTGATGGVVFYELGLARPDIVLKDLASIFHPELFPGYTPIFYKQLPNE